MKNHSEGTDNRVLLFKLDAQQYALPFLMVDRVVSMVHLNRMPDFPDYVKGIINVHGELMAVLSLRVRFGLKDRQETLKDMLIIVTIDHHSYALMADVVGEIAVFTEEQQLAPKRSYGHGFVKGARDICGELTFLCDANSFVDNLEIERLHNYLKRVEL